MKINTHKIRIRVNATTEITKPFGAYEFPILAGVHGAENVTDMGPHGVKEIPTIEEEVERLVRLYTKPVMVKLYGELLLGLKQAILAEVVPEPKAEQDPEAEVETAKRRRATKPAAAV